MDHSHHDHAAMGHGELGMDAMRCNMNMLFTWDTDNLCIVFRQWHITGTASLIFSLLAIVAICAGYEALREVTRRYETWLARDGAYMGSNLEKEAPPSTSLPYRDEQGGQEHVAENSSLLGAERIDNAGAGSEQSLGQRARVLKAVLYGVQNFYALLFMTYNGYVMIAVAVGAGLGYYLFGSHTKAAKDTACH
ncbi:Ctr copper transporter family-domain-containing protein [Xylariaceae sp. FL0255]|nr:Ctr copper transporter family-domain-containing protein [Xylariaceae sp. FL0255]